MNNVLKNVLVKNKNQSLPLKNCNGTILKWLRKPSAGYKKDIGRFIVTFNKNECCWKEILQRCLFFPAGKNNTQPRVRSIDRIPG